MPIILPPGLPAAGVLTSEGRPVSGGTGRPAARVALLNLMPDRMRAEAQFARALAHPHLDVELVLAAMSGYAPTHQAGHVRRFYSPVQEVIASGVDALIVTGAPVERLAFEDVAYWDEFCRIMHEDVPSVPHCLFVCWAAQAALFVSHGVPKRDIPVKAFGVFEQEVLCRSDLLDGMGAHFPVPVSRHTTVRMRDLRARGLSVLAGARDTGPALAQSRDGRHVYSFNHFEYDAMALADEFHRDLGRGMPVAVPFGYFPHDDPACRPQRSWAGAAARFFSNWTERVAGSALSCPAGAHGPKTTFGATVSTRAHTDATTLHGEPSQA